MNAEDALLPKRKNPKRGKGKKMHDRIGDGRWLEREIDERIGAPNPSLKGSSR